MGLYQSWLKAQWESADIDEPLLAKAEDGSLQEVTQEDLYDLVKSMEPGDVATLGGFHLACDRYGRFSLTSTTEPNLNPEPKPRRMGKAANSDAPDQISGLQALWAIRAQKHAL